MDLVLAYFLQSLPEERRASVASCYEGKIPSVEGSQPLPGVEEILHKMHPSRLEPFIEHFSRDDQKALLSILTESQAEVLKEELRLEGEIQKPSALIKKYLLEILARALISEAPPIEPLLAPSALNELLNLSNEDLDTLCGYLGLHDLASEVKKIIQSDKLKGIEAILNPAEKKFLKKLVKGKELVTFGSLNLQNWDGSAGSLREVLHGRGINRLAKALYGSSPTLIWLLSYRYNEASAAMLQKFCVDPKNIGAQDALKEQVVAVMKELT